MNNQSETIYCLDTNVFIEAWNKYYSMDLCPDYWQILDELGQAGVVISPIEVKREIDKIDDSLSGWIKEKPYLFQEIDTEVQIKLREIMEQFPRLVDNTRQRSIADPWVIALAQTNNAIVVTKEQPTPRNTRRIKIPDVCNSLGIPWIDDFQFARAIGLQFQASINPES